MKHILRKSFPCLFFSHKPQNSIAITTGEKHVTQLAASIHSCNKTISTLPKEEGGGGVIRASAKDDYSYGTRVHFTVY